jgi:hypothetical protein
MMRVQITGDKELLKRLQTLAKTTPDIMREVVLELTLDMHKRAVRGIQRGPATGRTYVKSNPNRTHVASAPGQFPMSDTGRLASGIEFEPPTGVKRPEGVVGTNVLYGKYLELKPAYRGGRPWLMRAFNEAADGAQVLLVKVFKRRTKT